MILQTCMENMWESYCCALLTCVILYRAAVTWLAVSVMLLTERCIGLTQTFLKEYTMY